MQLLLAKGKRKVGEDLLKRKAFSKGGVSEVSRGQAGIYNFHQILAS